jgi:DNA invertase Pin-like site-specific DNA recombinase
MVQRGEHPIVPNGTPMLAAQYVRMSTEHQKYSTENQAETIRQYAEHRGIKIVKTYADEGKSGLKIDGRSAFKQLLADVENKTANFGTILVYDASRWGRFQDSDEGAYYEYRCKRAGITVQYCAEQFENDGSPTSAIIKSVKRAMAGEYSRELSVKVFSGQCRLIELGYRQGGPAGYGLRRKLIDQSGEAKGLLTKGEHKSIQTDRVILVPGPPEEIETIRWIYRTFVENGKPEREIAHILNARRILTDLGHEWSRGTVHQILINEKYVGNNVWNRVSFKLKKTRVRNGPDMLVRAENAFEPIVDRLLFDAAQVIICERSRRLTDDQMLESLRQIYEAYGYLSGIVIDEAEQLPSSSAYQSRFGSLLRAYQLVGFTPDRDYTYIEINRSLRSLYPDIIQQTIAGIEAIGGTVVHLGASGLLQINGEFSVSIVIARCLYTTAGSLRWSIRFDTGLAPDLTIAVRMDESNREPLDYYFLPRMDMSLPKLRLAQHNGSSLDAYRFDNLKDLFSLAARANLQEVA